MYNFCVTAASVPVYGTFHLNSKYARGFCKIHYNKQTILSFQFFGNVKFFFRQHNTTRFQIQSLYFDTIEICIQRQLKIKAASKVCRIFQFVIFKLIYCCVFNFKVFFCRLARYQAFCYAFRPVFFINFLYKLFDLII